MACFICEHDHDKVCILMTHVGVFRDPLAGRDPQFEKPCSSTCLFYI